jgi:IclR family pca regulon transcriptional regulator
MSIQQEGDLFVRALARGLTVIEAFDNQHARLTLADVAKRTDMTRATVRRLLHTLCSLGYVYTDGKYFSLKPKVLNLGFAYLSSLNLAQLALPLMEELVADVHESCSVSVLDEGEAVYVTRVPTKRIMSIGINIGTRFPAMVTSMGRVLLSGLSEQALAELLNRSPWPAYTANTITSVDALTKEVDTIRQQGFALVVEELEQGLISLAMPIKNEEGQIVAAINLSSHITRHTPDQMLSELKPALEKTAKAISAAIQRGQSSLNRH